MRAALSATFGVTGWFEPGTCHAFCVSVYPRPSVAIELSMIVTITSFAPVFAFKTPAMPPYRPPAIIATRRATSVCTTGGRFTAKPTHTAASAPTMIWPLPPMLNRPARKPSAKPRPEMISGIE